MAYENAALLESSFPRAQSTLDGWVLLRGASLATRRSAVDLFIGAKRMEVYMEAEKEMPMPREMQLRCSYHSVT